MRQSQLSPRFLRRTTPLSEVVCRRLTLAATVLGSSMASVTATSVALPAIRSDFGIGFGAQQWIVLSYSLALASLYLVAGAPRRSAGTAQDVHRRYGRFCPCLVPGWDRPECGGSDRGTDPPGRGRRSSDDR